MNVSGRFVVNKDSTLISQHTHARSRTHALPHARTHIHTHTHRQMHTHTHTRRHCRHIYIIEGKLSRWKRLDCLFTSLATDYWTVKFCFSIASYSVVKAATTVAIITTAVVVSATTRGAAAAVATWVLLPYIREGLGSARQKKKKKNHITLVTWRCMQIMVADKCLCGEENVFCCCILRSFVLPFFCLFYVNYILSVRTLFRAFDCKCYSFVFVLCIFIVVI